MRNIAVILLACLPAAALAAPAKPALTAAQHDATHAMFEHVINTPTVIGRHKVPEMAQYVADQFKAAGFPAADVHVMPYHTGSATTGEDDTAALIVRWRAAGKPKARPIMLHGPHGRGRGQARGLSTTDPFVLTEKDGYYYGRGTIDMKDGIVGITQAMINLKAAGFKPKRDIVVLFTGDEETNGIGADQRRRPNGASCSAIPNIGLNADGGGGGVTPDGRTLGFTMQTAEKTFAGYTLTVRNRGGHSSKPRKDNAIYQLAHALDRIEAYRFTPMLNETTRAYFAGAREDGKGPARRCDARWLANPDDGAAADAIEASESEVGLTRTRCVADAAVRRPCRQCPAAARHGDDQLPHLSRDRSRRGQGRARAHRRRPDVVVSRNDKYVASIGSPLRADVTAAYTRAVQTLHPGMPVFPEMSTGASDARPFRVAGIPVYGINGGWVVVPIDLRAHGKDERLPVQSLYDNVVHWQLMLRDLAGK